MSQVWGTIMRIIKLKVMISCFLITDDDKSLFLFDRLSSFFAESSYYYFSSNELFPSDLNLLWIGIIDRTRNFERSLSIQYFKNVNTFLEENAERRASRERFSNVSIKEAFDFHKSLPTTGPVRSDFMYSRSTKFSTVNGPFGQRYFISRHRISQNREHHRYFPNFYHPSLRTCFQIFFIRRNDDPLSTRQICVNNCFVAYF